MYIYIYLQKLRQVWLHKYRYIVYCIVCHVQMYMYIYVYIVYVFMYRTVFMARVDCELDKEFLNHQDVHVLTCILWKYTCTLFIYMYSHAGLCIEHVNTYSPVHEL